MRLRKIIRSISRQRVNDMETEKGFTLVEVMLAISILSIGLLAIASMHVSSIDGNSNSRRLTEAMNYTQDKLEELQTLSYSHTLLKSGDRTEGNPPDGYTIAWNVSVDNPVEDAKLITVTTSWQVGGEDKATQLSAVIYDF